MKISEIRTAFIALIKNNWVETAVEWQNIDFKPEDHIEWIRPRLTNRLASERREKDVDGLLIRRGTFIVDIFVKEDSGDLRAMEIADLVEDLLTGFEQDKLYVDEPTTDPRGVDIRRRFTAQTVLNWEAMC